MTKEEIDKLEEVFNRAKGYLTKEDREVLNNYIIKLRDELKNRTKSN